MKRDWADPSHVGKITVSHLNLLSKAFHKQMSKAEEEKDYDLIIKLSQAAGYQAQLYSGLQKSHEFSRRLESIEKQMGQIKMDDIMLQNPILTAEAEIKSQIEFK